MHLCMAEPVRRHRCNDDEVKIIKYWSQDMNIVMKIKERCRVMNNKV
jgi:hypothetical protein